MTIEEKKEEVAKIKCTKCGKLNPVDTVRCIHCAATIRRSVARHY